MNWKKSKWKNQNEKNQNERKTVFQNSNEKKTFILRLWLKKKKQNRMLTERHQQEKSNSLIVLNKAPVIFEILRDENIHIALESEYYTFESTDAV